MDSLTSHRGLELPREINETLSLNGLKDASGLVLPKRIGGILWLSSLDDISGLIIPDELDCKFYSMIYKDDVINLRDYINKSNSFNNHLK